MDGSRTSKNGNGVGGSGGKNGKRKVELKDPEADDLKRIVLDFLSTNCYLSTARALSRPSPPSHSPPSIVPSPSSSTTPHAPVPTTDALADPNGEDVQMMSDSVLLPGRTLSDGFEGGGGGASSTTAHARSSAVVDDPDGNDLMAVDEEPPTNGFREGEGRGHLNGFGGGNGESNGRSSLPGVRFNPSLKVNGKGAFQQEFESVNSLYAGALTTEELNQIEERGHVRTQILRGNISAATSLLTTHFPQVLSASDSYPSASMDKLSSSFKPGPSANGDNVVQDPSSATPPDDKDGPFPAPRTARPLSTTSFKPSHTHLNLLIQGFIETLRTVPVGPPQDLPGNSLASPGASLTAASSPASSIHSASSAVSATSGAALAQARTIHLTIDRLEDGPSKDWYKIEFKGAMGLLAYASAEMAHPVVRTYLEYSRREALAEQINSAILVHTGHHAVSTLDTMSRQETFVWDRLSYHNLDPIPPWTKEDGAEWERLSHYFREHRRFALSEFLDS